MTSDFTAQCERRLRRAIKDARRALCFWRRGFHRAHVAFRREMWHVARQADRAQKSIVVESVEVDGLPSPATLQKKVKERWPGLTEHESLVTTNEILDRGAQIMGRRRKPRPLDSA